VRNRKSEHVKTFLGEKEKGRSQRRENLYNSESNKSKVRVGLTFLNHKHIISEKGLIVLLFVEFLM